MDEYLILESKDNHMDQVIKELGFPYTKIQSKLTYYLVQVPSDRLKELYPKGSELIAKINEIPVKFSEFKNKFAGALDTLLSKEELPLVNATRYVPMCSPCGPIPLSELKKRDSLLEQVYKEMINLTVKSKPQKT